jgi:hypothetical protein
MAKIPCHHCGLYIDENAGECPFCHVEAYQPVLERRPADRQRRTGLLIGLVVAAIALPLVCGGVFVVANLPAPSRGNQEGPQEARQPGSPRVTETKTSARSGDLVITIKRANVGPAMVFADSNVGWERAGQYLRIYLEIKNAGKSRVTYHHPDDTSGSLTDEHGNQFAHRRIQWQNCDRIGGTIGIAMRELGPGESVQDFLTFSTNQLGRGEWLFLSFSEGFAFTLAQKDVPR